MIRLLAALALLPTTAGAEQRDVALGSFERVRINGSFAVTIATGAPAATVEGDRAAIGAVDLHADGTTLTIRQTNATRWGEQRQAATAPLRNPPDHAAPRRPDRDRRQRGDGRAAQGARVDLSAAGTATLAVAAVEADQLGVQLAATARSRSPDAPPMRGWWRAGRGRSRPRRWRPTTSLSISTDRARYGRRRATPLWSRATVWGW